MPQAQAIQFSIQLNYHQFLAVYQGHAQHVIARAHDGRRLRFPADILKPYLTREGIQGTFVIQYDQNNKFQSLVKLTSPRDIKTD
ncbi:MAG TPA: DUF2835 family protein [Gammaproteobacteria bacterium]|nr:DUF2835 family protein [Gammaproteobacteria bacterium]